MVNKVEYIVLESFRNEAPEQVLASSCPCDMHEFLYLSLRRALLDSLKAYFLKHNCLPEAITLLFASEMPAFSQPVAEVEIPHVLKQNVL